MHWFIPIVLLKAINIKLHCNAQTAYKRHLIGIFHLNFRIIKGCVWLFGITYSSIMSIVIVCMMTSLSFHLLLQIDCANLLTFHKGDDLKLRGWMVKQILMRSALKFWKIIYFWSLTIIEYRKIQIF